MFVISRKRTFKQSENHVRKKSVPDLNLEQQVERTWTLELESSTEIEVWLFQIVTCLRYLIAI